MKQTLLRIVICIIPFAFTPILGLLLSDGYLNFGGGEKDILLLIPWLIWSILFLAFFVTAWIKRLSVKKGLIYSAGGATAILFIIWIVIFVWTLFY